MGVSLVFRVADCAADTIRRGSRWRSRPVSRDNWSGVHDGGLSFSSAQRRRRMLDYLELQLGKRSGSCMQDQSVLRKRKMERYLCSGVLHTAASGVSFDASEWRVYRRHSAMRIPRRGKLRVLRML